MTKLKAISALYLLLLSFSVAADDMHMEDDPLLFMFSINELERHDADGNPLSWNAEAWLGKDLNKFRLKTEGERINDKTESAEVQALYSHAIAPYWDLQLGARNELHPDTGHEWAVIGLQGLAPYWFEINAALFIGEDNRTALRFEAEYEILFTQKLILSPEIELNFYSKDDPELGIGSGLSEIDASLRLRYEIRRELAPYIGINWARVYEMAGDTEDSKFVLGFKMWL
ncbi:MAG TPA: copper resistance protein B [Gammaproteobacteria bacterium]